MMFKNVGLLALYGTLTGATVFAAGCTRPTTGFCTQATQATDCGTGMMCKLPDQECIQIPADFCQKDDACSPGQYCKLDTNQCVTATVVHGEFSGGQLSPPTASNGRGALRIILQPGQTQGPVPYTLTHSLSGVTGVSLHVGNFGMNAVQDQTLDPSATSGTIMLTPDFTAALTGGGVYAVIKTSALPGGEVRAQLYSLDPRHAAGRYSFSGTLSGLESLPSNVSTATGKIDITYDDVAGTVDYTYSQSGIKSSITGIHLHRGGFNVDGGHILDLPPNNMPSGNGTISRAGVYATEKLTYPALLKAGIGYLNLHTTDYPKGELRGQLQPVIMVNGLPAMAVPFNTALAPPGGGLAQTGETAWYWSADRLKLAFRLNHNVTASTIEAIVTSGTPTMTSTPLKCDALAVSAASGAQGFCDVAQVTTAGQIVKSELAAGMYFFAIRNTQTKAIEVQGAIKVPAP